MKSSYYLVLCFFGFEGCHGCAGGLEQAYKNEPTTKRMTNFLSVVLITVAVFIDIEKVILCEYLKIAYNQ